MATIVTASCPHCQSDIKIRPDGVHVYLYSTGWPNDYYAFFCPECKGYVQKDADAHVTQMLIEAGVRHTLTEVPLEVVERKACRTPVTGDDILNLISYLRDHDTMPESEKSRR